MKYVLSWHESIKHGGNKAKEDVDRFLKKDGYKVIKTPSNKFLKVLFTYVYFPILMKCIRNSEIVYQFPSGKPFIRAKLIKSVKRSSNKLIMLIHDIEALRMNSNNTDNRATKKVIDDEIMQLKNSDGIISHNSKMTLWLKKKGVSVPIVNLEIFDYDNPQKINQNLNYEGTLCFAGNLGKSSFLKKLELQHKLDLYGMNPAENYHKNIHYEGNFSPDELPKNLTQNFGLVWDGPDIDSCRGIYGEYMRFNNPHKVSLYLSSGIPIIIWKKAAMAEFIQNNNLGIAIEDLKELDEILDNMTQEEYVNLKKRVIDMSKSLRNGTHTISAMNKLMSSI